MPVYLNSWLKKCLILYGILSVFHLPIYAQASIHLNELYRSLEQHHPYRNLNEAARSMEQEQKKINALSNLPQTNFLGQATWQSAVTEIPQFLPGLDIPGQAHDQYRAVLELNQTLYDGGTRRALNEQASRVTELELANTGVLLFGLKETVCRAYYAALMANLSIKQFELLARDLEQKAIKIQNQIKEGVMSGYQDAALQIKIKETRQNLLEAKKQKSIALNSLKVLTGMELDSTLQFSMIDNKAKDTEKLRPELVVLDAQRKMQASQLQLSNTRYQPKVQVFGQLGYGRPGLNLLSNDFEPYSILGLRWQWNLSNIYTRQSQKEKNILQTGLNKIKIQEDAFLLQQNIKEKAQLEEIDNLTQLIKEDQAMITLHERVVKSSEAQFENGIITINEYATDTYNLSQAKLKTDIHLALLSQSKELLKLIHGN